jgi:transposase-like protein
MARSVLNAPQFQSEAEAFAYVEARLWPNGPVCPHCQETARIGRLNGKTTRPGLHKCYACKKPFTVRMGTIFESSHLPLHLWLQIIHLFCASKKGISTRQIQRMLNCSMKTAWFLGHRIREAMDDKTGKIGGLGATVEADETYLNRSPKTKKAANLRPHQKGGEQVFALVERGGKQRSVFLDHRTIRAALFANVHPESRLVTDGHRAYRNAMTTKSHETVDHRSGEYVRGDVHTNNLEGFFSILKRGLVGIYQHVDKKHLQRYLAEFDFRHNTREKLEINDTMRASILLQGFVGKRLTYRTTGA